MYGAKTTGLVVASSEEFTAAMIHMIAYWKTTKKGKAVTQEERWGDGWEADFDEVVEELIDVKSDSLGLQKIYY